MAQQPYMKDLIVDALFQKPQKSWSSIEGEIKSWCSHMTIERFVKSFHSFGYDKEHIFTNISPNQWKKHLEFFKLVFEIKWNFLDGNGNYLDEIMVFFLFIMMRSGFGGFFAGLCKTL